MVSRSGAFPAQIRSASWFLSINLPCWSLIQNSDRQVLQDGVQPDAVQLKQTSHFFAGFFCPFLFGDILGCLQDIFLAFNADLIQI